MHEIKLKKKFYADAHEREKSAIKFWNEVQFQGRCLIRIQIKNREI